MRRRARRRRRRRKKKKKKKKKKAFLACHQCYCADSSLAWGLNLRVLVCGIF